MVNDLLNLTPHQRHLMASARYYQRNDMALPADLAARLLAAGLSPDPFNQIDIEDCING